LARAHQGRQSPVTIVAGEVFDLEVAGEMKLARMEWRQRMDGVEEWSTARLFPARRPAQRFFGPPSVVRPADEMIATVTQWPDPVGREER
jgi:hypothetical protein